MGPDTHAVMKLKKECWMTVNPEGYGSAVRRRKQSQGQQEGPSTSSPGSSSGALGIGKEIINQVKSNKSKVAACKSKNIAKREPHCSI